MMLSTEETKAQKDYIIIPRILQGQNKTITGKQHLLIQCYTVLLIQSKVTDWEKYRILSKRLKLKKSLNGIETKNYLTNLLS